MAGRKVFRPRHPNPNVARLERLRKLRGESMARFAKQLGISWRAYQAFVLGTRQPRLSVMRVAELLEKYETPRKKK
jgi:transcriptional regulator with XRE-family HTH domain